MPATRAESLPFGSGDEIRLIDIYRFVVRRRWIIIGFFFASVIGSILVMWLLPSVYESRTSIQIGQIQQVLAPGQPIEKIENPAVLIQRLKEEYQVDDESEGERKPPYVTDVQLVKESGGSVVVIKAEAYSAQAAQDFLKKVTSKLLRTHRVRRDKIFSAFQNRLGTVIRQKDEIQQAIALTDERIRFAEKDNTALAAFLTLEKSRLVQQKPVIDSQISELKMAMSSILTSPTTLLREPTRPVDPVRPKPLLYIILSAFLGLALGILAALYVEFFAGVRNTQRPDTIAS